MLALLAAAVLQLANGERVKHHVPPLAQDPVLEAQARRHRGRRHSPVAHCAGDRGQNLAWGDDSPSARTIVNAWMASPEHRANLLDPAYRLTGVGVARERGWLVFTQDFARSCIHPTQRRRSNQ